MFRTKHPDRRSEESAAVAAPAASSRQPRNVAARMGRWSAAHWKTATFGWLAFVVVAFALGGMVGMKSIDLNAPGPGESGRMDAILDAGFKQPAGESVLIQSRSRRAGDPAFAAAIEDVVARVSKVAAVQNVHAGQVSKDGHAALVEFEIRGDRDKAIDKIGPVLDGVAAAQGAHPGFFIGEFGDASAADGVNTAYGEDLAKAGFLSIPVTLIILVLAFGAIVAMAGMFLTGDQTFASLGLATILVVAVAVLGSLTVLPAVLSRLGDKVDRLRVPLVGRLRRDDGEGRIWGAIVDRVLRRPALSAALAAGLLLALAAPALQLHLAAQGPESFPKSLEVMMTYTRMQQAFPGSALPAQVVVKAPNVNVPAVRDAINRFERQALASGRAFDPITVDVNKAGTVANITVPIAGNGTDAASNASFRVLRETIVPETVGAVPNTEAGVTGRTAGWRDAADELKSNLLPVVAFNSSAASLHP